MKNKHVKDVAEDVAQDVAEDVLGAVNDGGAKMLTVARAIFQRRNPRPTQHAAPTLPLGDT